MVATHQLTWATAAPEPENSEFILRRIEGREALSSLYEYELELFANSNVALSTELMESLLNARCEVTFGAESFHGVLREIELLPLSAPDWIAYRAVLVPELWRSTLNKRSRCNEQKSILS